MPLPIMHCYAGYTVYRFAKKREFKAGGYQPLLADGWALLFCIILANLADFDFLPGLILGKACAFHRSFSHSLIAAPIAGLIATVLYVSLRGGRKADEAISVMKFFLLFTFAYASHIALDFLNGRHAIPLFWPISSAKFGIPLDTLGVGLTAKTGGFHSFASALWGPECLIRLAYEAVVVGFFILIEKGERLWKLAPYPS